MTKTAMRIGTMVAMVVLAACGKPGATLQELQISPPVAEVTESLRTNVAAVAVYSDGARVDVTAEVQWSTQDAAVATAEGGVVQAGQPGSTYVTAAYAGLQSSARVDVIAAQLLALQVATDAASRPAGLTARATATGDFSDGSTRDVTAAVQWSASSAAAAVDATGTVRAIAAGPVDVVATLNGLSASAPFTVTAAEAVSLAFQDVLAAMPLGVAADVHLLATFTDGSVADVTAEAVLTVADAAVATVDGAGSIGILSASARKVRGLAAGRTELQAAYAGLTAAAPVEVLPAALAAITVSGPSGAAKKGEILFLTAQGTFTDGSVQDVTGQVTWTSGDQAVALVYDFIAPGAVLAYDVGTATVTAIDPVTQVSAAYELTVRK